MTKFKQQGFSNTFKNARKGMRLVLKSEINIRVHFCLAMVALALAFLFDFSVERMCILLLTIGFVIVTEMVNSAIEYSLDAVFHNRYSRLVGMAKDISARSCYVCFCDCNCNWCFVVWLFYYGKILI